MSQNFGGEFQIPAGDHNPNSQMPIYDELDIIFGNSRETSETPIYRRLQAERTINPDSKRLFDIAESLASARSYHLDSHFFTHTIDDSNVIKAVAKKLFNADLPSRNIKPLTLEHLIKQESVIGASLFGPRRPNEHIEFFNDKRESWFFYQEITDSIGTSNSVTLHYEVHPTGVLRISNKTGINYEFIQGQEFDNFMLATEMYHDRVLDQIYNRDSSLGKKLQ